MNKREKNSFDSAMVLSLFHKVTLFGLKHCQNFRDILPTYKATLEIAQKLGIESYISFVETLSGKNYNTRII